MLVIATQDYENYAAHEGFSGEYRWKAKGGSEYKITNIPANTDPAEIVELVRGEIECNNEYFQSTIVGYGIELDTIDNLKIRFKSFTGENLEDVSRTWD